MEKREQQEVMDYQGHLDIQVLKEILDFTELEECQGQKEMMDNPDQQEVWDLQG